jgi:hypothetical protein
MRRAVELMRSKDERVATVCIQIILDRAGVRPIDRPEDFPEERRARLAMDYEQYSQEELAVIEQAMTRSLRTAAACRKDGPSHRRGSLDPATRATGRPLAPRPRGPKPRNPSGAEQTDLFN